MVAAIDSSLFIGIQGKRVRALPCLLRHEDVRMIQTKRLLMRFIKLDTA